MALVQLTEPQEAAPRRRRFAVGIDLGTTNSLVAAMTAKGGADGEVRILHAADEAAMLPSAVHYAADGQAQVLVGEAALARRQAQPQEVVTSVKRLMGRSRADIRSDYHYEYSRAEGMVKIRTAAGEKSPVEVSADILRALRARALAASGEAEIAGAVITVPAYFDDAQRQATKDAAKLAGLPVLRLLNEPTAAAVAYGLEHADEGLYAVYDLGGGTFDVSLLRLSGGVFQVLATGGDTALGGDDYDRAVAKYALEHSALGADAELSPADWLRLTAAARTAKEALTENDEAEVHAALQAGECRATITRAAFAEITQPLTDRTLAACRAALADAGVDAAGVDGVVLVGGATRMPPLRAAVEEFFGQAPRAEINPDEVVARGAAAQADVLIGNRSGENWLLLDVIPLSLGLETMGGLAEKLIHRNTTIPIEKRQEFTTHQDGQTAMRIHVVQGERELVADCRSLATFTLTGIPPLAAGLARIRVSFQVDADGLLSVTASERTTGVSAGIEVKPSYGLSEAEFSDMLRSAYAHAKEDLSARRLREAVNDGNALLAALDTAMAEEPERQLLSPAERETITGGMETLRRALAAEKQEAIDAAKTALQQASEEFAARRMNADIRRALAGKRVEEVGKE